MSFGWLKRYVPRGLYGRAALILILPVLTIQLVVSIVFVQRHFEGVTVQMVDSISRELNLFTHRIEAGAGPDDAALADLMDELGYDATWPDADGPAREDERFWYDLTGGVVTRTLVENVPALQQVRLPTEREVIVVLGAGGRVVELSFDRSRVSASNPHQLLVNMLVFGVLFTIIAYLYLRNQLRPITRLAHAASAFGKGQRVDYKPSGAIEVREAGTAFLDMRARIERQIEQRTRMLSGVSHDLRTPLTRLKLGLSMQDDDAEATAMLRDVEDMQRLVDEFLSFARGDAASGEPEEIDPVAFAQGVVEDARRGGIDVTLGHVDDTAPLVARPLSLRRALDNLIGNAVRYGTRAEVSVEVGPGSICFRVEDDGPGIPEDDREAAMRPFVRLDPARNQDMGSGVGLGLTIAADIARGHGGTLVLGHSDRLGGLRADIVLAR
ncbi:ATP-binding protein [Pseudaestuariivita atlantica]|uniref:histidine kinase n=1 Tax=Pseudaestuariivita atlantica TaxID=1317121 RepID=A0A0L1JN67_9RHOB|nr:ATP-binding protein [Pseudaestuariivita atlantica]KNG92848.1 histidine kinase [Pseudaestuariivita atlantica]